MESFPVKLRKIRMQKPRKEDLNDKSAYRPITLESLISKCIVTMIRTRLEWKLESSNQLSYTQEAYRCGRDGNNITIRLTQNIQDKWNIGETVIVFISDFKNFFESVWRPIIIIKLHRAGITGNMLKLVSDYLLNRMIRFNVNSITTDWMFSEVGTPQGSGLSTIVTNVYSSDNTEEKAIEHG